MSAVKKGRKAVKSTKELARTIRARARQLGKALLVDSGQDLIEYALVMVLIALAATVGMAGVATKLNAFFTKAGTTLGKYTS